MYGTRQLSSLSLDLGRKRAIVYAGTVLRDVRRANGSGAAEIYKACLTAPRVSGLDSVTSPSNCSKMLDEIAR